MGLLYRLPFTDKGQIWCTEADRTSTLTCQISSKNVHCVGFQWPKTTILGKFELLGGSCTDPLLTMKVKFGVLKQTERLHVLTCRISSECVHCVAFRWPKTTILGKF